MSREKIAENLRIRGKALQNFIQDKKALMTVFVLFTGILLYQHSLGWNWDFLVYSMNAEYIFHNGNFMEWLRPPVVPIVLGLLQFFVSKTLAEYIFILISSTTFLYSVKKLSESEGLDLLSFYIFMLTPAFIAFGTSEGTELLSLAFVLLFISDLGDKKSGLWLGLAILTRYTYGALIPLLLLKKNITEIVKAFSLMFLVSVPWLLYSWTVSGDPFTSPISFIALNVLLRVESTPINLMHFLYMTLPTAFVLLLGLRKRFRERIVSRDKFVVFTMAYIGLFTGLIYFSSSITHLRYLFPLVLPIAYFSAVLWTELDRRKILYLFIVFNLLAGLNFASDRGYETPRPYLEISEDMDCMVESDSWAPLNYAGTPATHPVNSETTVDRLERGWRVIDFSGNVVNTTAEKSAGEIIHETGAYTIYGNPEKCAEPRKVNQNRIDEYNTAEGTDFSPTGFALYQITKKLNL